ncbi:unnamed protein product [Allacma fusca]|uniref:Gustatory receptor n=1 Tax=Allacma fusca TaxID=39272 RepID=A0A8J2J962_9HEXA|nr:unnamed protein product [Allacma fusca]
MKKNILPEFQKKVETRWTSRIFASDNVPNEPEFPVEREKIKGREDNSLYHCIRSVIIFGYILRIFSFKITTHKDILDSEPEVKFKLHSSKFSKVSSWCIKSGISIYLVMLAIKERNKVREIEIMELLWKCTFAFFVIYILTVLWTFEFHRKEWTELFEKSKIIEKDFRNFGMEFNLNSFRRFVFLMIIFHSIFGIGHSLIARVLNKRKHIWDSLGGFGSESIGFQHALTIAFCALSLFLTHILEFIAWITWHFADTLRIALAIYVWLLYFRLNRDIARRKLGLGQLFKVMSLHLKVSNLLGIINKIIGPITFVGSIFCVLYSCFYINYLLAGYGHWMRKLLFVHFLLKNFTIYLVSADINAKAHSISGWLETLCVTEENFELPPEKANKLTIFTAQIYCKDSIGFKGLDYFTISTSFLTTIVSVMATYTVVITQFSSYPFVFSGNGTSQG